jgi:thiosulfate/3-mercaptopyruvate sulfurtransferase
MTLPPIAEPEWVIAHADAVILADVRFYLDGRSGRAEYERAHLPGAVYVELEQWLAGPGGPEAGRHPLPDPEVFARGMAQLGIGEDDTVVGYDDAGGVIAARLVWMLRATGHDAVLLDGGLQGYPGALEQGEVTRPPARFTPRPWPAELIASLQDAADPANVVIDARERPRFRGEVEAVDPRPGHIPGARNVPARENVDPSGRLLADDVLRTRLAAAGVDGSAPVVSYCGSGVTACHNLLVMEHLGLTGPRPPRLYPGSWSHYSADPSRPVARGE